MYESDLKKKRDRVCFAGAIAAGVWLAVACGDEPGAGSPMLDAGPDSAEPPPAGDAGIDADATAGSLPRRGSRLAPRYEKSADGYRNEVGIFDTKLNVPCTPGIAADGMLRCLPVGGNIDSSRFADAACTKRLGMTSQCTPPVFAQHHVGGVDPCENRIHIHRVSSAFTGSIYALSGGTCGSGAPPPPGNILLELAGEVPPTELVAMTRAVDPLGGGVGTAVVAGDDGSRFPEFVLSDVARNEPCEPRTDVDLQRRCFPFGPYVEGFSEPSCTTYAVHVTNKCLGTAVATSAVTFDVEFVSCGVVRSRVHAIGPKRASSQQWIRHNPTTCEGPIDATGRDIHDLGAELPASQFPLLTEVTTGGTRLKRLGYEAGGVHLPRLRGTRDVALGIDCLVAPAADGKRRCIPRASAAGLFFTDAACTVPATIRPEACSSAKHVLSIEDTCERRVHVYPLGAELPPATPRYRLTSSGCELDPNPTGTLLSVGPELPATSFVEVTEVVGP